MPARLKQTVSVCLLASICFFQGCSSEPKKEVAAEETPKTEISLKIPEPVSPIRSAAATQSILQLAEKEQNVVEVAKELLHRRQVFFQSGTVSLNGGFFFSTAEARDAFNLSLSALEEAGTSDSALRDALDAIAKIAKNSSILISEKNAEVRQIDFDSNAAKVYVRSESKVFFATTKLYDFSVSVKYSSSSSAPLDNDEYRKYVWELWKMSKANIFLPIK